MSPALSTSRVAPILNVTEENSVLARHALKMVARIPNICGFLLSGRFDIYIGYCLKQVVLMILSPTFLASTLQSNLARDLIKMATAKHGVCRHGRILVSHFLLRTSAHVRSTLSYVRLRFIQIDKGSRDHRGLHCGGKSLPQLSLPIAGPLGQNLPKQSSWTRIAGPPEYYRPR